MGKGIALQFRHAFPDNFDAYKRACGNHEVVLGRMLIVPTGRMMNPKYIINFPTKQHWKMKSQFSSIESGLTNLIEEIRRLGIASIAVPALGCGNGGLTWSDVAPLIKSAFSKVPEVQVTLFEPHEGQTVIS